MARRARVIGVGLGAVLVASSALAAAGGAATVAKRVSPNKACTMVTVRQVEKAFGGPVAPGVEAPAVLSCTYLVGADPAQAPGGSFATQQLFPSFVNTTDTAKAAIEDAHAIDSLANDDLRDVDGVGKYAYFNATKGFVVVQASKKFAFVLTWNPGSVPGPISKREQKKLVALAKDVTKRAPR